MANNFIINPFILAEMQETALTSILSNPRLRQLFTQEIQDKGIQARITKLTDANPSLLDNFLHYQDTVLLLSRYFEDKSLTLHSPITAQDAHSIRQILIYSKNQVEIIGEREPTLLLAEKISLFKPVTNTKNTQHLTYICIFLLTINSQIIYPNKREQPIAHEYDVRNYLSILPCLYHSAKEQKKVQNNIITCLDSIIVEYFDLVHNYFQTNQGKSATDFIYSFYQESPLYQKELYSRQSFLNPTNRKKTQTCKL